MFACPAQKHLKKSQKLKPKKRTWATDPETNKHYTTDSADMDIRQSDEFNEEGTEMLYALMRAKEHKKTAKGEL